MKHIFTSDNLLPYLYHETSASQRLAIEDALHSDPVLRQELEDLKAAKQQFPKVKFNAPKRALDKVLNYSRSTSLETQL